MLYFIMTYKYYEQDRRIIESDAIHYYSYLPSLLVHHDLTQSFLDKDIDYNRGYFFTDVKLPDGKRYFKTTMGVALLQSVFIVPIHYTLELIGAPATGVSAPYKAGIILSSLLYLVLGLFIVRYLLIKRFKYSEYVTALTILAIGLASNAIIYVIREPGVSHIYSFFSILLFIYIIDKFLERPTIIYSLITGLSAGLILLIRPVNIVVLVIILTWNITNWHDFKERFLLFIHKPLYPIMMVAGGIIIWLPQLAYYYFLTGSIFFSGYGNETKFFFNNPQILDNLFSYRKGWFLYTPVMLLAVIGLIPLYLRSRKYFWPVITILVLLVYINSSWYSWWFGGSYGQRAYIDIYGLMALPMGAFINMLVTRKWITKLAVFIIFSLFIGHNIFQSKQFINGAVHYSGMTKEAYWYSCGRLHPGVRFYALLDLPDPELSKKGIYPKPPVKSKTKEEWIAYIEQKFRDSPESMEFFSQKAKDARENIDTLIHNDAIYTLKHDKPLLFNRIIETDSDDDK